MTRKKTQKKTDINTSENLISEDFFPKGIKIEEDKVFPMAVIATMSSGKSTLINALIGKEILPSANAACTALNYSILDDDRDTKEVICVTKKDGNVTVIDENLSEELEKINQDPLVTDVFIRSHVKGVLNTDKALLIIDTPGPNNSADKTHEKRLYQILDKISGGLFVYVINASQIGIEDDEKLLKILAPYLRKNQTIKILFVMNKIDVLDREKESIEECVQNVRRYLQNCGFENPNIIPISAVAALLFKKVLNHEKLTRKQYRDFIELYDMYQSNDYNMKKYAVIDDLEDPFKEIEVRGEIYKTGELNVALENTGIKLLEEKIQKAQILSGEQLKNTIKVMEKRKNSIKKRVLDVNVISPMSSGKSTLINALLQQELLPTGRECTAQVTRIIDHDGMKKFEGVCYGEDNKTIIYPKSEITLGKMREYNEDKKVKYIDLKGDIPGISSDKIRLCLRDTPGPNNLQDDEYRKLTNSVIKRKNSIVLYVMNVIQMQIQDDKNLLESIAQEMKLGGKEARDRFIFVLNKCDVLDEEKGETVDQKIDEAKAYLQEFEIIDPMIIPTNAYLAMVIQKVRKGDKLGKRERIEYDWIKECICENNLHFEDYALVDQDIKDEIKEQLTRYKKENDKESIALIHTGIPIIKELIRRYTL
ncbi:MAG: dynamin family protein [Anaerostipes hadrus]|nr:dynamin family protein [Anaerostipes hadrus]